MRNHWILSIYSFMLSLFPKRYQGEFGEELLYAVRMSLEEAQSKGRLYIIRLAWRELRDLPGACIQAHLRERRGVVMGLRPGAHLPDGPFEFGQLAALFLPLIVSLVTVGMNLFAGGFLSYLICGVGVLLLGLLVIVMINGLRRAFPIWALPSMGLILFFFGNGFSYIVKAITLIALSPLWDGYWPDSIFIRLLMYVWFNLVYVVITAAFMMTLLALSKSLLQLARKDWTLLTFLAYSMVIPAIVFSGDEYHGLAPYQFSGVLILIAGLVLYVLLPSRWGRVLVLLTATFCAPVIVSLGLYRIFPAQDFAAPILSFRVWEAIQPVLELPALLVIMFLPVLVRRLPESYGYNFQI